MSKYSYLISPKLGYLRIEGQAWIPIPVSIQLTSWIPDADQHLDFRLDPEPQKRMRTRNTGYNTRGKCVQ